MTDDIFKPQHIIPVNDLIEHDTDEYCVCQPEVEILTTYGTPDQYIYIHHSLDGREYKERGQHPPKEP